MQESPDARVRQIGQELESIRSKKGPAAYWEKVREYCWLDLWFLVRVVLKWGWLDEVLVGQEMLHFYDVNKGKDTAVFVPRGHGKTLLAAARCIQEILKNPNVAIMFASATEDLADKFGQMIGQTLMENDFLQKAFPGVLPASTQDVQQWGKPGYSLPQREPRIDPTLYCASLNTNVTGRHPDIIFLDDLIVPKTNSPLGYEKVEKFLHEMKMLLPPQGVMHISGTRYHDADPYSKILAGKIIGKKGNFATLVRSCFIDDMPEKGLTYPFKLRWNMDEPTGYTMEQIEAMRRPVVEGGLGPFFDAQLRNDPAPEERMDIKLSDIIIYDKRDQPKLGAVRSFGIEITGGGRPIYQQLVEKTEELRFWMPLHEISTTRSTKGETKTDRIRSTLEPIVREGRLRTQQWMLDVSTRDTLGYELQRLGFAEHDDIADALHNAIQLAGGTFPAHGEDAHLYLASDLAWTEERRGDFTVTVALAVDEFRHYWVVDYDRFQLSSPSQLCDRLISFYRKWENDDTRSSRPRKNYALTYR